MDFAKKLLNKYGWKEGEGLGKNNDGIVKPLKASLKFDNTGLGADQAAADFNNHWWERVFNEAAQNVEVKDQGDGVVSMDLKNHDDSVEISTKGYSVKKLKRAKQSGGKARTDMQYDNFLQSATLSKAGAEVENEDKIAVDDIAVTQYKVLTDEELFRACGGRTAHKGARHGLKLSGKLERLERQEQEMLEKIQAKMRLEAEAKNGKEREEKIKKRKTEKPTEECKIEEEPNTHVEENCEPVKKKKRKSADVAESNEPNLQVEKIKKKKNKTKDCEVPAPREEVHTTDSSTQEAPKTKKKKRKDVALVEEETSPEVKVKKSKKNKKPKE